MDFPKHRSDGHHPHVPAARLRALGETGALTALALFLAFSFFSGRLRFFVAGAYLCFAPAAAVLILGMVAARLKSSLRAGHGCDCHGHVPGRIPQRLCVGAILLGIGFAVCVNPQQYSAEGVRKRRMNPPARDAELETAVAWILGKTPPPTAASAHCSLPSNPTVVELLETAAGSPRSALEGQFVTVVGQCILRDGPTGKRLDIYRLVVTCCVADALSVSLEVARNTAESLDPGGWISVAGTVKFDSEEDPSVPVIHAATLTKIAEPAAPYL